jgi:MFS family permease
MGSQQRLCCAQHNEVLALETHRPQRLRLPETMSQIGKPPCDEAVILHAAEAEPCSATTKRWVLVAAICGSSMAFVDGTVVNVALPAIQRDLNATASEAQWVVESYALFLAALLLVGGSLGDRVGRRRVFAIGIAIFAAASLGCALSADIHHLIAARAIQGIGAALLVPGSLSLISASFPESERGRAIGTWSGFSGITAAIGPVLGGYLVDHYSWIWAFLINVPLAIVVLVIVWKRVPESRSDHTAGALDFWGAGLATVALGGIVYAFIEAPVQRWDSIAVLTALFVGLLAAAAFVVVERKTRSPMLPLRLFRIRNFVAPICEPAALRSIGWTIFFPSTSSRRRAIQPRPRVGAVAFILIMFVLSRWAGAGRPHRFKLPLVLGPTIAQRDLPCLRCGLDAYWTGYFPAVVVLGAGMAVTVAPLTTTVMILSASICRACARINNAVARAAVSR